MAIVKMNRIFLLTFERNKPELLKRLQAFERVHFRKLSKEDFEGIDAIRRNGESAVSLENDLSRVKSAAGVIKPYAEIPKGLKAMTIPPSEMTFDELDGFMSEFDERAVSGRIKDCDERRKAAQAELQRLKTESDNLRAWVQYDVSPAEIDRIKNTRHMVGSIHKNLSQEFVDKLNSAYPSVYVETLHTVKDDTFLFIIAAASQWDELSAELKNLGVTRAALPFTGIPLEKVSENERRIETLNSQIASATEELNDCAGDYSNLMTSADFYGMALERARACDNFMNLADVLVVDGWVPEEDSGKLGSILESVCGSDYYLEEAPAERDSAEVPIALKNNKFFAAFEEVTSMFALPRYNEIDPTPLLAPFYLLFFGLMVGDAGYGLVLLAASGLALKFLHLKKGMRKFMTFFFLLSFGVIFAGVLYGSVFGFALITPFTTPEGEPKAILDSGVDILLMLILSIAIGVVQVLFGLCVKAYMLVRDGKPFDAFCDSVLWLITLISGLTFLIGGVSGIFPDVLVTVVKWGFFGGLVALLLTQGRTEASIGGKLGMGFLGVYGITGYLGDFISYSRLAAIALSGAYIASSFNIMANLVPMPAKFIFGLVIFVAGQSLNMGLGFLGAYVHGCRLQFVEFFGKFYEGGGISFKPFSPKNVYIKLKEANN